MRPKPAASLAVLDRISGETVVLMGRRRADLAFMPGKFVFPGGRLDKADHRLARLAVTTAPEIMASHKAAAIRECHEETGLVLVSPGAADVGSTVPWPSPLRPDTSRLRYFARAVTPVGMVRRFDTRFFAAWRHDGDWQDPRGGPDGELAEVGFVPLADAARLDIPFITAHILEALSRRLTDDPELKRNDLPVAEYLTRRGKLSLAWKLPPG